MSELNNPVAFQATENGEMDVNHTEGFSMCNDTQSTLQGGFH